MTTGIQAGGTDLDSLFMALSSTKRSDTGWKSNGSVDISNRFEPYATGTKVSTTGLRSGGSDLADLFQNISVPITTVTLSGQTVTHNGTGTLTSGIRVNTDGTIDQRVNSTYTQIDSLSDWIIPNGDASSSYQFRVTGVTGDGFTTQAASENTWVAISSNLEWSITDTVDSSTTFTLEVRLGTGATIDTASYNIRFFIID